MMRNDRPCRMVLISGEIPAHSMLVCKFLRFYLYRPVRVVRTGLTGYQYADRPLPGSTVEIGVSPRGNKATPCGDEASFSREAWRSLEAENEKLNLEHLRLIEENHSLLSQNQKLAEEASYAKELASAAAVELKNLAEEVTKLSLQNARQAKELLAAQDLAAHSKTANSTIRRFPENKIDGIKLGRRSRPPSRSGDFGNTVFNDVENWNLDLDDIRMELQARKQKEAALETALAEKEHLEEEYKRKLEEAKKREMSLENDLAGMWVLVAKLKKGAFGSLGLNSDQRSTNPVDLMDDLKLSNDKHNCSLHHGRQTTDSFVKPNNEQSNQNQELEPLLVRLKVMVPSGRGQSVYWSVVGLVRIRRYGSVRQTLAKIQEMKEREIDSSGNGDRNSHVCKVCFESPTAAVLVPCRHFCCKHFNSR
ncbi:hypothetical protein BHE74_00008822 [Ensete ventricosum]|nr:hypothetical protein BHE74_00008822 [Ensete ventricosum]